jgi:hypothetical protein
MAAFAQGERVGPRFVEIVTAHALRELGTYPDYND